MPNQSAKIETDGWCREYCIQIAQTIKGYVGTIFTPCLVTSIQHFEMLDNVDVGGEELLKWGRFDRDGIIRTSMKSVWAH